MRVSFFYLYDTNHNILEALIAAQYRFKFVCRYVKARALRVLRMLCNNQLANATYSPLRKVRLRVSTVAGMWRIVSCACAYARLPLRGLIIDN